MNDETEHETREVSGYETRVVSGDDTVQRSLQDVLAYAEHHPVVTGAIGAAVGGAGMLAGKVVDAVKEVKVAKIRAEAQVEVARLENGYPMEGGAHRADE